MNTDTRRINTDISTRNFRFFISVMICVALIAWAATEGEDSLPFEGEITASHVNVRAGGNINFEVLTQLDRGDRITVLVHSHGWYKIKIPQKSLCFVNAQYVEKGVIKADNVNLRARPDINSNIIGQLGKGSRISIKKVEEKTDVTWCQIVPPEHIWGWVSEKYVIPVLKQEELEDQETEIDKITTLEPTETEIIHKDTPPPVASGVIKDLGRIIGRPGTHKLVDGKKIKYYLKSTTVDLNKYENYDVDVWGEVQELPEREICVIDVERVDARY